MAVVSGSAIRHLLREGQFDGIGLSSRIWDTSIVHVASFLRVTLLPEYCTTDGVTSDVSNDSSVARMLAAGAVGALGTTHKERAGSGAHRPGRSWGATRVGLRVP